MSERYKVLDNDRLQGTYEDYCSQKKKITQRDSVVLRKGVPFIDMLGNMGLTHLTVI